MSEKVAILGASDNPDRYSYKAFHLLREYGHEPVPITPKFEEFEGVKAYREIKDVKGPIDTLTMYVGAKISSGLIPDILALKPKRVIFNPGSENPELAEALSRAGIAHEEACTLVLLRTGQY